jgi:hypothetical protein
MMMAMWRDGRDAQATAEGSSTDSAEVGSLLPCPFCGGDAAVEPDRWRGESVRIACANDACAVRPKTEFLLASFADELRAAWNGRPSDGAGASGSEDLN